MFSLVPSCGAPRSVVHAEYATNNFSVGYVVKYKCSQGYKNISDDKDIGLQCEHWSSLKGAHCVGMLMTLIKSLSRVVGSCPG